MSATDVLIEHPRDATAVRGARGDISGWHHRLPVFGLALIGCAIATYLTLYQWHVTSSVWDPIFGSHSSEAVLSSAVSRLLPVPDATLGAFAYLIEAIAAAIGGRNRYRTLPAMVLVYGAVLVGLAATSVALVIMQILLVHAFCTLCLCSAAISWINAWLGRTEVLGAFCRVRAGNEP